MRMTQMQHIKELVHPELLGQERKTKTEGATVQFTPVINAKPASVFSYCINLDGISQERDFEKSESLLFLQRKLGGAEGFEPREGE